MKDRIVRIDDINPLIGQDTKILRLGDRSLKMTKVFLFYYRDIAKLEGC